MKDAVAAARSLSFQRSSPQIFGKKRDRSQSKAGRVRGREQGAARGACVLFWELKFYLTPTSLPIQRIEKKMIYWL